MSMDMDEFVENEPDFEEEEETETEREVLNILSQVYEELDNAVIGLSKVKDLVNKRNVNLANHYVELALAHIEREL